MSRAARPSVKGDGVAEMINLIVGTAREGRD
jgi:hypothetical protein